MMVVFTYSKQLRLWQIFIREKQQQLQWYRDKREYVLATRVEVMEIAGTDWGMIWLKRFNGLKRRDDDDEYGGGDEDNNYLIIDDDD